MPLLREMAKEAGRDPASLSVTLGGAPEALPLLRRNRDLGVGRMTVAMLIANTVTAAERIAGVPSAHGIRRGNDRPGS